MAELVPVPFRDLVTRLYLEPVVQETLFDLPRRGWFSASGISADQRVTFHGAPAGNPSGPAAGPHTQMAQNLVLSYVAGARIMELKTIQVLDRLEIGRPCIDMRNIGFNIEWSQELLVEDSIHEYVAGMMLIEMMRHAHPTFAGQFDGPTGEYVLDLSVGYDLKGIKTDKVRGFLHAMRDASKWIEKLRAQIPAQFKAARELDYPALISRCLTLSTFHGCPASEIEAICEHLIDEHDLDIIVKMNPPMLGPERLEHLLHDVMGYTHLKVNPAAYTNGLQFDESLEITRRLTDFAAARGRRLGAKFSNTLEVIDSGEFFPKDNEVAYLSGQPLHVITLALTDKYRQVVGPDIPISFSAGIDKVNFASAVACGMAPVTVSSDLLRTSGFGRLPAYMKALDKAMGEVGAANIDEFVLRAYGNEDEARRRAAADRAKSDDADADAENAAAVRWAGVLNTSIVAEQAEANDRYYNARNTKIPKRIDSHLVIFDCITCDKCIPVCPNAANFTFPTPKVEFEYSDLIVNPDGSFREADEEKTFKIDKEWQIANFGDFCNDCGNCDTFCPEYGGPFIAKPTFFGSVESYEMIADKRDGFVVERDGAGAGGTSSIRGRIKGREYRLAVSAADAASGRATFDDGTVGAVFSSKDHELIEVRPKQSIDAEHTIDVGIYHTLRYLLAGVLDPSRINQVNVALVDAEAMLAGK